MKYCRRLFLMPRAAIILAFASLASLAFALTLQYGFDVAPCQLCIWQRIPFALGAMLALAALVIYRKATPGLVSGILLAIAVGFFVNCGLAVFHSGIERHWWEWHSSCTGSDLSRVGSIDDLRRELLEKPVVRCDQISWSLFGLTMANLNIVYSALLAVFAGLSAFSLCACRKGQSVDISV